MSQNAGLDNAGANGAGANSVPSQNRASKNLASQYTGSFSDAELRAMKERAAELRAQGTGPKGAAKRQREAKSCLEAIAALPAVDRTIAERLHTIVLDEAPHLDPKTWYGFPAYARENKVVVFFQPRSKFDTRYGTIGFNHEALLDDGVFWPVAFAVLEITEKVEARLRQLVKKAAG